MYAHQVGFDQIHRERFDLFIAASGYENRSTYLASHLPDHQAKKIALCFDDRKSTLFRPQNDLIFRELGFECVEMPGNNSTILKRLLDRFTKADQYQKIKILVDYSCMSKTWLSGIIDYFSRNEENQEDTEVFFSYTPSWFDVPQPLHFRKINWDLPGIFNSPGKHIAVILGLGYEKFLAESLFQSLKDHTRYVFYSNPAFDNRFVEEVLKNNEKILENLEPERVFRYPIRDLKETDALLTSLCLELRLNHRVVLISMGPKPFLLSCLLLSARYPDVFVWNITSSISGNVYNREPQGEPLVCKTMFTNKEDF